MSNWLNIGAVRGASPLQTYTVQFDLDNFNGTWPDMWAVYEAGVPVVQSGARLFEETSSLWIFINQEFTSEDGLTIYSFQKQANWPYFFVGTRGHDEGEANDLTGYVEVTTPTTSTVVRDGVVMVYASGTNVPLTAEIAGVLKDMTASAGTNNLFDYEAEFTGVGLGQYDVIIKDSVGFTIHRPFSMPLLASVGLSSYGLLYYFNYKDIDGGNHRLEILERDYSGSSSELGAGDSPVTLSANAIEQTLHELTFIDSTLTVRIVSNADGQFDDFATGDDEKYLVKHYRDNTGTDLDWQGYLNPYDYSETLETYPKIITITASDRISDLSSFDFGNETLSSVVFNGGTYVEETLIPIKGQFTQLVILYLCLSKLNLNQGYRIACNIFEENHTSTGRTPLDQTYINTECYYDEDGTAKTCDEVIKSILAPYGAYMVSCNGYYYILRKEEMQSDTVNYIEYDASLAITDDSGSFTTQVEFKANLNTDHFRWINSTMRYEPVYRNIFFDLEKSEIKNGFAGDPLDFEWEGWSLNVSELQSYVVNEKLYDGEERAWKLAVPGEDSYSYLQRTGSIEFGLTNKINISLKIRVYRISRGTDVSDSIHYVPLRWVFRVGTKYMNAIGEWEDVYTENQYFIDSLNEEIPFEIGGDGFEGGDTTYELRIYIPSLLQSDGSYATKPDLKSEIETIATTSLKTGTRFTAKLELSSTEHKLYHYELQDTENNDVSTIERIKPDDFDSGTNSVHWKLVGTYSFPPNGDTYSEISEVVIEQTEIQENIDKMMVFPGDSLNKIDLTIPLFHYDLSGMVSGDQYLFTNYLMLSDGTQTASWDLDGTSKLIQQHLGEYYAKKYKEGRRRITGSFYSDSAISLLNTLLDDGYVYLLPSLDIDFEAKIHSCQALELINDGSPLYGDWKAGDWDSSDWFTER